MAAAPLPGGVTTPAPFRRLINFMNHTYNSYPCKFASKSSPEAFLKTPFAQQTGFSFLSASRESRDMLSTPNLLSCGALALPLAHEAIQPALVAVLSYGERGGPEREEVEKCFLHHAHRWPYGGRVTGLCDLYFLYTAVLLADSPGACSLERSPSCTVAERKVARRALPSPVIANVASVHCAHLAHPFRRRTIWDQAPCCAHQHR